MKKKEHFINLKKKKFKKIKNYQKIKYFIESVKIPHYFFNFF
jgi:hypothetical protein